MNNTDMVIADESKYYAGDIESCNSISGDAGVIEFCINHQKRIVDDVLTVSKLDAKLLIIASEPVQVASLINDLVRIYGKELEEAKIGADVEVCESFHEMQVNIVKIDPGRLLQVLINLFTNAIKFTRDVPKRHISLRLGASFTRPELGPDGAEYVPFRNDGLVKNDATRAESAFRDDNQQTIFLEFVVKDSGHGLDADELKRLFKKLSGLHVLDADIWLTREADLLKPHPRHMGNTAAVG